MKLNNIKGLPNLSSDFTNSTLINNSTYNKLLYKNRGFDYLNWRQIQSNYQIFSETNNIKKQPEKSYCYRIGKIKRTLLKRFSLHKYPKIHRLIKITPVLYISGDRGYTAKNGETLYILIGMDLTEKEKGIVYLHELGHLLSFQMSGSYYNSYEKNEFLAYRRSIFLSRKIGLNNPVKNDIIELQIKSHILSCFETNLFLHPEHFHTTEQKNKLFKKISDRFNKKLDSSSWIYEVDLINYPFIWSSIYHASTRALYEIVQEENYE